VVRVHGQLLIAAAAVALAACGGDSANGDECGAGLAAGDLVITEVMADPGGGVEYWEIFNPGAVSIDLFGLALVAEGGSHAMAARLIAPGQYLTVGAAGAPDVDYVYGGDLGDLPEAGGLLELRCKGEVVDAVEYPAVTSGVAVELDGARPPDAATNDDPASFCAAVNNFGDRGDGSFGTPREANGFCSVAVAPTTCSGREVIAPAPGDVVITEVMPRPVVAGDDGEWFEILALADFDLNGLHAGTAAGQPRFQVDSADCIPVTAGQHLVFVRRDDPARNGGLPAADGVYAFALGDSGALAVGFGPETLDAIAWADSADGASISLGPRANDPVANDAATAFCPGLVAYNETDLGTPGAANDFCLLANECIDEGSAQPRDAVVPGPGDVAIVEWMANPEAAAGDDNSGEYIEIRFDVDADANGVQLGSDAGVVTSTIDRRECVAIAAGGVALFVRDLDPAQNGGIDNALGLTGFGILNGGDRIFVGHGDVELDVIEDTGNANADAGPGDEGVSAQIDSGGQLCDTPVGVTYGDGDRGSPGVVNPDC
jgi:hypothetical protein